VVLTGRKMTYGKWTYRSHQLSKFGQVPCLLGHILKSPQAQELQEHFVYLEAPEERWKGGLQKGREAHWRQITAASSKPGGFTVGQGKGGHTAAPQGNSEALASATLAASVLPPPALA